MTYAEYLKSQGATEDELKVLDVPSARKAYDRMQADLSAEHERAEAAIKAQDDYKASVNDWHETKIVPAYEEAKREATNAKAEAARAKAVIQDAAKRDDQLAKIAKDMGYEVEGAPPPPKKESSVPEGFDPSKYVTSEQVIALAERERDAIALAQDIAAEHATLFPGQRLSFRELVKEAAAAKKPVEQFWQDKYKVSDARAAQESARKQAYEEGIRKEEREKVTTEFASKYGNPDTRPLDTSKSPFAPRPDAGRDKLPWDSGDRQADRISRVATKVMKESLTH